MEEKRYDIDVERDVFIDRAVQTVINYENLIDNMGIDKKDIDNPVIIRYEEVTTHSIIGQQIKYIIIAICAGQSSTNKGNQHKRRQHAITNGRNLSIFAPINFKTLRHKLA